MTHMARLFILCCGWVMLGSGHDLRCVVTHGAGWTMYSVPEFNGTSCHYSWDNGTSHVVANHEGEIESLVLKNSRITLTTNRCLEEVLYKRDCISEGISCQTTCTTTCVNAGLIHNESVLLTDIRHHSCIVVVAALVLLLLVGLVFCALRCGRRHCVNTEGDVESQHG